MSWKRTALARKKKEGKKKKRKEKKRKEKKRKEKKRKEKKRKEKQQIISIYYCPPTVMIIDFRPHMCVSYFICRSCTTGTRLPNVVQQPLSGQRPQACGSVTSR
jgi:hypothetical protein